MSNAGASYVLANNAIMFAPQLHSSSAGLPFSLVAPSGQVFLTAPVSLSPALPLPFLPSSGLAPQIPSFTTSSYPYGVLTTPTSSALSYRQHAPYNRPVGIISGPLESPTALNYPSSTHSVLEASPTTASTLSQPISLSLPFLKSNEARPLQDPMASSFNQTLLQTGSLAPSAISMQQKQSQDRSKEPTSSSTASLKKLLAVEPPPIHRDPIMEQIQGEPDLTLFYNCFRASGQSHHLHVEVLPSQDSGSLKWLQVRQKDFYIDPELGPVVVARILVSSNRIVKLQILFPTYKTVYTKLFVEEEMEDILSELSTDHVICPGLPGYKDKYTVLGYHPSHVRILETCHIQRYDHEHCPIWHVPSGTFSKRDRILQNMCKQCKYLQNGVVRLATKACEVDPAERESWTDPSSNRPLAYMSAADREERYRKLRQERNQMLVKLRTYEERLGIGELDEKYLSVF